MKKIFQIMETLGSARIEGNNTTLSEYVEKIIEKNAKIPKFSDIIDFNNFTLDLNNYVVSEFALLIQHDGHIVNPSQWKDEFLNYD